MVGGGEALFIGRCLAVIVHHDGKSIYIFILIPKLTPIYTPSSHKLQEMEYPAATHLQVIKYRFIHEEVENPLIFRLISCLILTPLVHDAHLEPVGAQTFPARFICLKRKLDY